MTADFAADMMVSPVSESVAGAKQLLAQGIELANIREFERAIAHFTQAIRLSLAILQNLPIPDPVNRAVGVGPVGGGPMESGAMGRGPMGGVDVGLIDVTEIEITSTQSFYHRGCALCKLERYEGAIADFTHLIHQPPTSSAIPANWLITKLTEIYIHRGNAYRRLGAHAQALADLNQGVSRSGGSAQSYSCRGLIHLDMGDCETAIADFDQALSLHPTFAQGYLWRGFAWLRHGAADLAIADLDRAISAIPRCAEAFNHRGVAYFYLNDLPQAQADFSQAIRLNPEFAEAYNNRGNVLQLLGDAAAAKVDYDQAIALDGELAELYFNRAAMGTYCQTAMADYETTAALPLKNAAFYRHRAQVQQQAGRLDAAIADYTTAIDLTPTAYAFHQRGKLLVALGEYEQALADFGQAIEHSPDYGAVYRDRAHLRFELQSLEGALSDVNQAIYLREVNLVATLGAKPTQDLYAMRCLIQFLLGNQPSALEAFEQLITCIQSSSASSSVDPDASSSEPSLP